MSGERPNKMLMMDPDLGRPLEMETTLDSTECSKEPRSDALPHPSSIVREEMSLSKVCREMNLGETYEEMPLSEVCLEKPLQPNVLDAATGGWLFKILA